MEEQNLIFGIFSLLFVMSLVLFANLCVKLEKKKQSDLGKYAKPRSDTSESIQKLQSVSAMESALSGSIPHRHLSTSGSHYSDKRQRPFPTYTLIDKSPRSQSRSTCSTSPRSLNSLDLSSQRADLNRHRVGSESQKLKRDNPFVSHQRQWSMEAPRSLNSIIHRPSPVPYLTKPSHLSHEQLKRTEPMFLFNRDNSLRSSSGSVVSQRRSVYQPRSSPSGSVATGTLPIETPTPDPSLASSVFETNRNKLSSTSTKTIVPKYSDSKAKGTPVRTARTEITPRNDSEMDDGTSPYKHYIHPSEFNHFLDQNPTYNDIDAVSTSLEESTTSTPYYQNPRLLKRQLSHEDSNCYPPYYQPSTDSTCQLYSTQSNKNLPLRMRFPKLSNGTDFADDETEGTSVCQSIYSSYTSLYQTDTEEFMIGDPQLIKLSHELESSYSTDTDYRTPLVAQYAKQYTEDLIRTTRRPSNMSLADSDVSFVWQGGDLGKHEYTPNTLSPLVDKKSIVINRPTARNKQGYTDYTGGLSFFSFVRKGSIPEEKQVDGNNLPPRAMTSPSRFNNYPVFTHSPIYIPPESNNIYHRLNSSPKLSENKFQMSNSSQDKSKSNENLKTPQRKFSTDKTRSHPNLRSYKHTNSSEHSKSSEHSLNSPSYMFPRLDNSHNRNNSNNKMSEGSLTHL